MSLGLVAPTEADPALEEFDIVDAQGNVIGREPRSKAHQLGLLHKAVYVFVFDKEGKLLIQQRSSNKKIGPNKWDLSVAEHLAPGETFHQAACRGLQEELGLDPTTAARLLDVPLGPMHQRSLVVPGLYIDNELVQSYMLEGCDGGKVRPNPAEVAGIRFITMPELRAQIAAEPETFTEWLRAELELVQLPGDPNLH